jgi:chromosome segregation ATPase
LPVDTSIHNELRSDYYRMEQEVHEMVEGVHNLEDEISEELKESEELENLLSKVLHEIEDLEQKELAIERIEQKATPEDMDEPHRHELGEREKELAEEMFSELHTLAKDIDTARGLVNDLMQRDEGVRENLTKMSDIDDKLEEGQNKLLDDEDGLLHRLDVLTYSEEVNEDWVRQLEYKYKEDDGF